MLLRAVLAITALTFAFAFPVRATGAIDVLNAASSSEHAWVVLSRGEERAWLLYVSNDDKGVVGHQVRQVTREPDFLGAGADAAALVFEAEAQGNRTTRLIRLMRAEQSRDGAGVQFVRAGSLPSISGGGTIVGLTQVGDAWYLLRERESSEWELMRQTGDSWEALTMPADFGSAERGSLTSHAGRLIVLGGDLESRMTRWVLGIEGRWRRSGFAEPATGATLLASGSRIVQIEPLGASSVRVSLLRGDGPIAVGLLEGLESPVAFLPMRDRIVAIWREQGRVRAQALAWSGRRIAAPGPIMTPSPVTSRQLEVLIVLLASLIVSVGVFVVHPSVRGVAPVLPEGTALAEPGRRLLAGIIDFIPCAVFASLIWGIPIEEVLNLVGALDSATGIRPLLGALGFLALSSAVFEGAWGRTPGKWATGCRVVDMRGLEPGWRRSIMRSVLKVVCPVLALASVLNPGAVEAIAYGTMVVRRADEPEPEPPSDS